MKSNYLEYCIWTLTGCTSKFAYKQAKQIKNQDLTSNLLVSQEIAKEIELEYNKRRNK